ncbi:hypothetical protein BG015_012061, partial [Linnemannia schmuckeri]
LRLNLPQGPRQLFLLRPLPQLQTTIAAIRKGKKRPQWILLLLFQFISNSLLSRQGQQRSQE